MLKIESDGLLDDDVLSEPVERALTLALMISAVVHLPTGDPKFTGILTRTLDAMLNGVDSLPLNQRTPAHS